MGCTLLGVLTLSLAASFPMVLLAAAMVGTGSSVFHPESARIARMASGGRHGLAQSIFQVGGNAGTATGPLLAAWIVLPHGQRSIAVFSLLALLAMVVLTGVGRWYREHQIKRKSAVSATAQALPKALVAAHLVVLYYTFAKRGLLVEALFIPFVCCGLSTHEAQYHLFYFPFSVAAGTLLGGTGLATASVAAR